MRCVPSFYDEGSWEIHFSPFLPPFSLLTLFGNFWALPVNWEVWNIWKANRNMIFLIKIKVHEKYILAPFDLFWSLLTLFGHFWALPVTWEVWIIWKANRNMTFQIKGLPSFYDQRFVKYRFLLHWTPYGPIWSILFWSILPLLVPFDSNWAF